MRCKSIGDCGHKHKTASAAELCRERMQRAWSKRRSEQSKAAALTRGRLAARNVESKIEVGFLGHTLVVHRNGEST